MSNFIEFTPDFLNTPQGVMELNRILNTLNINIAGDTDSVRVFKGFGTPEGEVIADVGAIYMRLDGGTDTTLYRKESGAGNTGWVSVNNVSLPLSLSNGGTGQALSDPNADRIMFWDDTAGNIDWLTPGDNIAITAQSLDVTIPEQGFWSLESSGTLTNKGVGDAILTYSFTAGERYKLVVDVDSFSIGTDTNFELRFDGDSTNYASVIDGFIHDGSSTVTAINKVDSGSSQGMPLYMEAGAMSVLRSQKFYFDLEFELKDGITFWEMKWKQQGDVANASELQMLTISGYYNTYPTTDISAEGSGTSTFGGSYWFYKMNQ